MLFAEKPNHFDIAPTMFAFVHHQVNMERIATTHRIDKRQADLAIAN
jgi:hypothetical protein